MNPRAQQNITNIVCTTLQKQRKLAGLTLCKAAKAAGIDKNLLESYEKGRIQPSLRTVRRILVSYRADPLILFPLCAIQITGPFGSKGKLPDDFLV